MADQKEFSLLLADNRALVYGVIGAYCRDESAKDDLYQDVCVKAWEGFKSFSGRVKFGSWIGKIARNTAIDRLRRLSTFKPILVDNFLWEIADTEYVEESPGLSLSIIESLSPAERRTVTMRMEGKTFAEISEITGEPINRLLVRMHRIKKILYNKVKSYESSD